MTTITDQQRLDRALARRFRESLTEEDFSRLDEDDDAVFYRKDRLLSHVDARALETIEALVAALIPQREPRILDLMAGWDSHIPARLRGAEVVGLGLNDTELARNMVLDDAVIHDLNRDPRLPFEEASLDAVICSLSVDYLVRPLEVFADVTRVLRPGGLFLVVFSNRMFETKAVKLWRQASEEERVILVEEFFRVTEGLEPARTFVSKGLPRPAADRYARQVPTSDPVYAVFADREGGAPVRPARRVPEVVPPAADDATLQRRLEAVAETLQCPYCQRPLSRVEVPEDAVGEWGGEQVYLCLEDRCPYFIRGWSVNYRSGMRGYSYRFLYDPSRDRVSPAPVPSARVFKDRIAG